MDVCHCFLFGWVGVGWMLSGGGWGGLSRSGSLDARIAVTVTGFFFRTGTGGNSTTRIAPVHG